MCVEINLGEWLDMNINDNLSINSPVDNKNVVVVRARKTDAFFKAFKVAPNIWVAPERYYGESLSIDEEYKVDGEYMILIFFHKIVKKISSYKPLLLC